MSETRGVFKTGVSAVIYTNTGKLIKGNTVRDKFLVMADSVLFIDSDANVAGGYLGIHPTNNNVDVSFIKSTSPSGNFLRDDGSWAAAGGLPLQTGHGGEFLVTNGSIASWTSLTANTVGGTFLFSSGYGIDSRATGGSDVLNIGATNADVINYGNSATVHNFLGTAIYELQVNSYVTDKVITLNYGGATSSGIGVGFEVQENSVITGYFKTSADRTGFSLKAPSIAYIADLSTSLLSASRVYNLPDSAGTFVVGSVGDTRIAYGSGSALTSSSNLIFNGSTLLVNGSAFIGALTTPTAYLDLAAATSLKASLHVLAGSDPTTPNNGDLWYLSSSGYKMRVESRTTSFLKVSSGYNGIYFAQTPTGTNAALYGNDTDTLMNAANLTSIQIGGSTKFSVSSSLLTNSLPMQFVAGSTSAAPIKLVSGSLLTTAVAGSLEFLTDRLYFTKTTGTSRQTIAYLTDITTVSPGGVDTSIQFNNGGSFLGSDRFVFTASNYMKLDGSATFGLTVSNDPTSFVDIGSATTARASLRLRAGSDPTSPNKGDVWYTTANGHRFSAEGRSSSIGPLIGSAAGTTNAFYFAQTPSASNFALAGTDNNTWLNARSLALIQVAGTTVFSASPALLTNYLPMTFAAGSAGAAPITMVSGALLTTPVAGSVEFLTDRLYFTKTTGVSRQTVAYLTDIPTVVPGGADTSIQFSNGGSFAGSSRFVYTAASYLKLDGSAVFGLTVANDPTAFVDIAPAVAGSASLRIRSSGGVAPSTPNEGDIWNAGTVLWIRIGGISKKFTLS